MLLTTRDLAKRWQVTEEHVAELRSTGEGPAYIRLGHRTVRYDLAAVIEWEQARTMAAPR